MDTFKNTVNSIFKSPTEGQVQTEIAQEAKENLNLLLVDNPLWGQLDTIDVNNLPIPIEVEKDIQDFPRVFQKK